MNGSPFIASQTHFTPAEGELEREVWDSFKADSWRMKTILLQVTKKRVRLLGSCSQDPVASHAAVLWNCGADSKDHHSVRRT